MFRVSVSFIVNLKAIDDYFVISFPGSKKSPPYEGFEALFVVPSAAELNDLLPMVLEGNAEGSPFSLDLENFVDWDKASWW